MRRRNFISVLGLLPLAMRNSSIENSLDFSPDGEEIRTYWVALAQKLGFPILDALSKGELKIKMPVETVPGMEIDRRNVTYLEAFGRLLSGLAPWFQLDESKLPVKESLIKKSLEELYFKAICFAVDPVSPDCMNFTNGGQPLVDTAFLLHAFIRAPKLYEKLEKATKQMLLQAIVSTRRIIPPQNNWLLFAAIREAFLLSIGEDYKMDSINNALDKHQEWYKGDGVYGDREPFHWDYYNSFVIHPMLLDIQKILKEKLNFNQQTMDIEISRAQRYAEVLERLIAPDGSYPPIGRSLAYRAGAFQLLGQLALNRQLPASLTASGVRTALDAVIRKTMGPASSFNDKGWLQIGLYGHQRDLAESYISTGSLYLCSTALLPLGLAPQDDFWSGPALDWTSKRVWSGGKLSPDHSINI